LLALPFGPELLVPMFKSGFMRLKSGVPELQEAAQQSIQKAWKELPEILSTARQKLESFHAERLY